MVNPDLKPVPPAPPPPPPPGVIQQTESALLVGAAFSTIAVLPVLATVLTIPIVTGAGFLLITASVSGRRIGIAVGIPVLVIDVDGASVLGIEGASALPASPGQNPMAVTARVAVAPGAHTVELRVSQVTGGGSFKIDPLTFPLQESASLVVMEANG